MACSRILLLGLALVSTSIATRAQTLKEKLYGGQIKADTGAVFVSKDTSKYVVKENPVITAAPVVAGQKQQEPAPQLANNDQNFPDSLNKLYLSRQRLWQRFITSNVAIITDEAKGSRKVKKGVYDIEIEYEIGLKGRVVTRSITCEPNNPFLLEKFTELMTRPPVLSPRIHADGQPRVSVQKQPVRIEKN